MTDDSYFQDLEGLPMLSKISKREWVMYVWEPVRVLGTGHTRYVKGPEATLEEMIERAKQWDEWEQVKSMLANLPE